MCLLALGNRYLKKWAPEHQNLLHSCTLLQEDEKGGAHELHEIPSQEALLKAIISPAYFVRVLSGCCAEYIGCFKPRDNADNRLRLRTHRWYDPHHELFEGDSSRYAEGPFYVIQGSVIDGLVRSGLTVRMGGPNEGKLMLTSESYSPD